MPPGLQTWTVHPHIYLAGALGLSYLSRCVVGLARLRARPASQQAGRQALLLQAEGVSQQRPYVHSHAVLKAIYIE